MSIKQFSLSALADLMIEEEPEDSYFEDEDDHESLSPHSRSEKKVTEEYVLNATDKSFTSHYSNDYDVDDFEQESVCNSPQKPSSTTDVVADDASTEDKEMVQQPENSNLTELTNSDIPLNYSDNSSRTVFGMPGNTLTLSPRESSNIKTLNYNDLQEITGVDISNIGKEIGSGSENDKSEHELKVDSMNSSPSSAIGNNNVSPQDKSSPSMSQGESSQNPKIVYGPNTPSNVPDIPVKQKVHSRIVNGPQSRGYSAVTRLDATEARRMCPSVGTSTRSTANRSHNGQPTAYRQLHSAPKVLSNGEYNLNSDDIKLMRDVRSVLNKIEQNEAVSKEVHKVKYLWLVSTLFLLNEMYMYVNKLIQAMPRKSVAVQGVKLGSGKSWNERYRGNENVLNQYMCTVPPQGKSLSCSCDSSGVFNAMSFYDEDDTRDVNVSAVPSHEPHMPPKSTSVREPDIREHDSVHGSESKSQPDRENKLKEESAGFSFTELSHDARMIRTPDAGSVKNPYSTNSQQGINQPRSLPTVPSEEYFALASLAEKTYASFLSDIIGM